MNLFYSPKRLDTSYFLISKEYEKVKDQKTYKSVQSFYRKVDKMIQNNPTSDIDELLKTYKEIDELNGKLDEYGFSSKQKKNIFVYGDKIKGRVITATAQRTIRWNLLEHAKQKSELSPMETYFYKNSLQQQALTISKKTSKNTALYKLKKDDKTIGILLPTCHLVSSNGTKLPKITIQKLKKADYIGVEINLYNDNQTIEEFQEECTKQYFKHHDEISKLSAVHKECLDKINLNRKTESLPVLDFSIPLEKKLISKVKKIPVVSLETCKTQSQIMINAELRSLNNPPETTISGYTNAEEHFLCDMDNWLRGDIDILHQLSEEMKEAYFISSRNVKMVEKMDELIQEKQNKKGIYAIGFQHFSGEQGILPLLKEKGYKVVRIDNQSKLPKNTFFRRLWNKIFCRNL